MPPNRLPVSRWIRVINGVITRAIAPGAGREPRVPLGGFWIDIDHSCATTGIPAAHPRSDGGGVQQGDRVVVAIVRHSLLQLVLVQRAGRPGLLVAEGARRHDFPGGPFRAVLGRIVGMQTDAAQVLSGRGDGLLRGYHRGLLETLTHVDQHPLSSEPPAGRAYPSTVAPSGARRRVQERGGRQHRDVTGIQRAAPPAAARTFSRTRAGLGFTNPSPATTMVGTVSSPPVIARTAAAPDGSAQMSTQCAEPASGPSAVRSRMQ